MIDKGRILYVHSSPARSMKEFDFTIVVSIAGKNLESAKNKLSGWLEPSLALKKNDAISLASVDLSDNVGSETKKSTKKTKKALPKAKKAKEEPEEEEDDGTPRVVPAPAACRQTTASTRLRRLTRLQSSGPRSRSP